MNLNTLKKMKFSIKNLLKKSLIENLIFCPVIYPFDNFRIILEKPEVVLLLT